MVGIAFGKDSEKQSIGDVLVATAIVPYESQRVSDRIEYRSPIPPSNQTLLNRFTNVDNWNFPNLNDDFCRVRIGQILSGEKLIDDPVFKKELFDRFPTAIGGEMEGAGLCVASGEEGLPWILVKAICDWADGNKNTPGKDEFQRLAADAAASLSHHILSQKTVLNGIGSAKSIPLPDVPKTDTLPPQISPGNTRKLVEIALSDEQLSDLCHDEFPAVYRQFSVGQTKSQRIRLLVEYVDRQRKVTELLTAIESIDPNAYNEFMGK
jgi:hypothetical protein